MRSCVRPAPARRGSRLLGRCAVAIRDDRYVSPPRVAVEEELVRLVRSKTPRPPPCAPPPPPPAGRRRATRPVATVPAGGARLGRRDPRGERASASPRTTRRMRSFCGTCCACAGAPSATCPRLRTSVELLRRRAPRRVSSSARPRRREHEACGAVGIRRRLRRPRAQDDLPIGDQVLSAPSARLGTPTSTVHAPRPPPPPASRARRRRRNDAMLRRVVGQPRRRRWASAAQRASSRSCRRSAPDRRRLELLVAHSNT